MLDGQMLLPIVGNGLVERSVLLVGDVLGVTGPDGLILVLQLHLHIDLLDLLGPLLLLLLFIHLLNLWLVLVTLLLLLILLLLLFLVISHLLLSSLLDLEGDGEPDELGVLLDQVLQAALLQVLLLILLQVQGHLGTALDGLVVTLGHSEGTASSGLPHVALILHVLGDDGHPLRNQIGGVKPDTELSNHADVSTGGQRLHELLSSGARDGTQVVDHVSLGHTNPRVNDCQGLVGLVWHNVDEEVGLLVQHGLVSQRLVPDLVQSIGRVGDQLSQEDFLVRVEGVDDQAHQLVDLCLKVVGFC
mmetsp:Transcript_28036/g.47539  ORF Transcript_28036/g.47539 Transcript_28036/m.47539 type:complete len:303 (-) Transcript_28036:65-973(-)